MDYSFIDFEEKQRGPAKTWMSAMSVNVNSTRPAQI